MPAGSTRRLLESGRAFGLARCALSDFRRAVLRLNSYPRVREKPYRGAGIVYSLKRGQSRPHTFSEEEPSCCVSSHWLRLWSRRWLCPRRTLLLGWRMGVVDTALMLGAAGTVSMVAADTMVGAPSIAEAVAIGADVIGVMVSVLAGGQLPMVGGSGSATERAFPSRYFKASFVL
jgi:hypothetical protein